MPQHAPAGYVPPTVASLRVQLTDTEGAYWVRVTENAYAGRHLPTIIDFALERGSEKKTVLSYGTSDYVRNIFAPEGDSVVVTVSETGSAEMVRAFGLAHDQVTLLLERGTKFPPEFLQDTILIHTGWIPLGDRCCTAEKTEIWTWTGKNYRLASTVPYERGYEALAKLPPSAWKQEAQSR